MYPTFIRIGDFVIGTYGVMVALGFFVALTLLGRRCGRFGLDANQISAFGFVAVLSGLAGSRVLYILLHLEDFMREPIGILFSRGGFVFIGGAIGGGIGAWFWCRKEKISFWETADLVAPVIPLAHVFGRIGCFLNGCCYGGRTDLPIGVRFPRIPMPGEGPPEGSPAFLDHLHQGFIQSHHTHSLPVHPTQLYSAFGNLVLFGFLLWLSSRRRFSGQLFLLYGVLYSIFRFIIEMFRGEVVRPLWVLSSTQILCIIFLGISPLVFQHLKNRPVPIREDQFGGGSKTGKRD